MTWGLKGGPPRFLRGSFKEVSGLGFGGLGLQGLGFFLVSFNRTHPRLLAFGIGAST